MVTKNKRDKLYIFMYFIFLIILILNYYKNLFFFSLRVIVIKYLLE